MRSEHVLVTQQKQTCMACTHVQRRSCLGVSHSRVRATCIAEAARQLRKVGLPCCWTHVTAPALHGNFGV
jgi:hypothetical protein